MSDSQQTDTSEPDTPQAEAVPEAVGSDGAAATTKAGATEAGAVEAGAAEAGAVEPAAARRDEASGEVAAEESSAAAARTAEKGAAEKEGAGDGPVEAKPAEPTPEQIIERLKADLDRQKAEAKSQRDKMLRVAADFDNYRKRSAREVDDARERGRQAAVKQLLPVFDNLERATGHVDDSTNAKSMADGLRMVHKQFLDVLGRMNIERVPDVGHPFDPMVHEAIQYEHHESAAGLVSRALQPGYRQGDQLLRPALVIVSKGPEPAPEAAPDEPRETELSPVEGAPVEGAPVEGAPVELADDTTVEGPGAASPLSGAAEATPPAGGSADDGANAAD